MVLKKGYIHGNIEFFSDKGVAFLTFFSGIVTMKETFDGLWVKFASELFIDMDKCHTPKHF